MSRLLTSGLLAALLAFGAYGAFGAATYNGLASALAATADGYCPGAPTPFKTSYTGVDTLDNQLRPPLCFFTILVQGPRRDDVSWSSWYILAQLAAGWALIALEGLRRGNRGRVVSWTGTLGAIFQLLTFTVCVPFYLIVHLFTSPLSTPGAAAADASVDPADLGALPLVVTAAYVVPSVLMLLPAPGLVSAEFYYATAVAWQIFPVLQSVYHWVCKRLFATPLNKKTIYRLVLGTAISSQLALFARVVASSPSSTGSALQRAFVPYWPWNSPVVAEASITAAGDAGLAELVQLFLQWDVYCGSLALLVWAVHGYSLVGDKTPVGLFGQVATYVVLGGPVAAAAKLLSERDDILAWKAAPGDARKKQ